MSDRIHGIVAALPCMKNLTEVRNVAERSLAEGDAAFVADLGIALARSYGSPGAQTWQYRGALDHLLRLLTTTPGARGTDHGLRLAVAVASLDRKRARHVASLLAVNREPEELAVVFAGGGAHAGGSEELRACLVHEMVLKGVAVQQMPGVAQWARSPHWRYHPLRWLPLSPSPLEEAALSHHGPRKDGRRRPREVRRGLPTPRGTTPRVPSATETTADAVDLSAAVAGWADASNGRVEARTYDLDAPLTANTLTKTLADLGLKCLGSKPRARVSLSTIQSALAWSVLFTAASTGGAYGGAAHGAYGRLFAWRSLATLSHAAEGSSPDQVERRAWECAWYDFGGNTDWFDRVAWGVGLVAVAPGHRRLAVLAATDTD